MGAQFNNTAIQRASYNAYLVRLWQDTPDTPWRASVQSVQSGKIVRFGSLYALFAFLKTETHDATAEADSFPSLHMQIPDDFDP